MKSNKPLFLCLLLIATLLSACTATSETPASAGQLKVVATISILADVVSQVGGENISLTTLVPVGANEHEYQPAPRDIAAITDADIVFQVGLGLEEFMEKIIVNSGTKASVVTVSEGITPREFSTDTTHHEEANAGDQHTFDPHVWMDPANVEVWTNAIATSLSASDPEHQQEYQRNAEAYITKLNQLDSWITEQVETVPTANRKLVTDHMLLGYFAAKYGFEMVGAVIPSYSSAAQPSAQELAALEDAIRQYGVKAILVGNTVNPSLADRIASDTGILLVSFYTGSLSTADGPAGTYLEYMRYNVTAIVTALGK